MGKALIVCPVRNGKGIVLDPTPKDPHFNWVECAKCQGDGAIRVEQSGGGNPAPQPA